MQFRLWIEQDENPVIIINKSYLFDLGMSGARARGELVQAMEPIKGDQVEIKAGQLGVLLDESSMYYTIAISMGISGFMPIKTESRYWSKTGTHFDGDEKKLEKMSQESAQVIPMVHLKSAEDQLRQYPQVKAVFTSERQMRAILHEPPRGPGGYNSPYQIIINNEPPGMLTLITVVRNETRSVKTDLDNLPNAIQAAVTLINQFR